jgi:membrane protease YdiL (CAAX protease family)
LGVGGRGVGGLGVGGLGVGVEWVRSRYRGLSQAMALHVAKSVVFFCVSALS